MTATRDPLIGTVLAGGFRVEKGVGSGAFARVYAGVGPGGDAVAVKVLQDRSDDARRLFQREVKIMRQLPAVPHRVRYFGEGHTDDGRPFLAMEFVDGGSLRGILKQRGTFPEQEACKLMVDLCDALADLHHLGVVHRDLKPDNVLLTRDGRVKLSDFGLVKDAQGLLELFETEDILSGRDFSNKFDQNLVMGTPEYMAPEQFTDPFLKDPTQAKTDTWTDVYALGLIFYHLLAGQKLWVFRNSAATPVDAHRSLAEYIKTRTNPRNESVVERPPLIPEAVWPIISRALRHDPKRRYANAAEMAQEIRHYRERGEVAASFDDDATSAMDSRELFKNNPELAKTLEAVRNRHKQAAAAPSSPPPPQPVLETTKVVARPPAANLAEEFTNDATEQMDMRAVLKEARQEAARTASTSGARAVNSPGVRVPSHPAVPVPAPSATTGTGSGARRLPAEAAAAKPAKRGFPVVAVVAVVVAVAAVVAARVLGAF
ncbi:MAG: serine/threonine-protein kinase [Myxococcota bacterium]